MTRRQTCSRTIGIAGFAIVATFSLLSTSPALADEAVDQDATDQDATDQDATDQDATETTVPEPAEEPAPETGQVDGDTVAVGVPPVPPTGSHVVAVGLPPVPPSFDLVAVGLPPVAPTDEVAVGQPPVPPTGSDVVAVGQPPVPPTGSDVVAVGQPPVPPTIEQPSPGQAAVRRQAPPAAEVVVLTPAVLRVTADAAFDVIDAWF